MNHKINLFPKWVMKLPRENPHYQISSKIMESINSYGITFYAFTFILTVSDKCNYTASRFYSHPYMITIEMHMHDITICALTSHDKYACA